MPALASDVQFVFMTTTDAWQVDASVVDRESDMVIDIRKQDDFGPFLAGGPGIGVALRLALPGLPIESTLRGHRSGVPFSGVQ